MKYTYHVYVIRLHPEFANEPEVIERNPNRNPHLDCVYVGQSHLSPEARFSVHVNGKKSKRGFQLRSRKIKKFIDRLMPELYSHLPAFKTRDEAEAMEEQLAEELRIKGYTVWEGFKGTFGRIT